MFLDRQGELMDQGDSKKVLVRPDVLKSLDEIYIEPLDFIHLNQHKVRDVYRIGQVMGTGSFAQVRFCIHKEFGM